MRRNTETTPETEQINANNQARNQARNQERNQGRNQGRNNRSEPRYSTYRYGDLITPIYTECPITQETFQEADEVVMIRQCRHLFKSGPFHEWIEINQSCPYCRSQL
jgi:hypothetical protein